MRSATVKSAWLKDQADGTAGRPRTPGEPGEVPEGSELLVADQV